MVNSPAMKREPVDYIQRTREQYDGLGYPAYEWVRIDEPPPFVPVPKPLTQSRVGLIGSGGIYCHGQVIPGIDTGDEDRFVFVPPGFAVEDLAKWPLVRAELKGDILLRIVQRIYRSPSVAERRRRDHRPYSKKPTPAQQKLKQAVAAGASS